MALSACVRDVAWRVCDGSQNRWQIGLARNQPRSSNWNTKSTGTTEMVAMKWIYKPTHPKANERGFVNADELGWEPERQAQHASIMSGRFYENTKATDGTDIGSRRKHRAYMKAHGLTTMDDYTETWKKAEAERKAMREGHIPSKARREALERGWYEIFQK